MTRTTPELAVLSKLPQHTSGRTFSPDGFNQTRLHGGSSVESGFKPSDPEKVCLWKTINADVSCLTLRRLRRAIWTFRIVLIHYNARPHSVQQLKCDVSDHPAYSPDLVTSDFHLFPELKDWIGGKRFQENEEIQSNVMVHLTSLTATFFEGGSETCSTYMII
ncbi:hypothetical protein AVEN_214652-1 [Araneus ventricosus]|uniref:Histone-lysine N-methyltransferase SETMAR n=1 Tax=Araneus ventricosus TaxID=182803 RepID=A0A4Y2PZB2_ARAVE|nr:hypothetical protein AVEN_214652-1 [Araneus ventricosus]